MEFSHHAVPGGCAYCQAGCTKLTPTDWLPFVYRLPARLDQSKSITACPLSMRSCRPRI